MVNNCVEHLITKLTPRFETDDIIAQKSGAIDFDCAMQDFLGRQKLLRKHDARFEWTEYIFLGARCILSSDGMNFRNCMVHDLD